MLISEFNNREEVLSLALRELKEIGIKVRSEKCKLSEVNIQLKIPSQNFLKFLF